MISFSGEQAFPHPPAAVAEKLADCGWLVGTLPDVQIVAAAPERASWRMKPKLAFITSHLDTVIERTDHAPGGAVGFRVVTKAIGATSTVRIRLAFAAAPAGTAVAWTGELVEVTGLLKMVPKGLLQSAAEKVIGDVWAAVGEKMNTAATDGHG